MKKFGIIIYSFILMFSLGTATKAEIEIPQINVIDESVTQSPWEIGLQQWDLEGSFDYLLYYAKDGELLSKVTLPQNQAMNILDVKYDLPQNDYFLKFQYGQSGKGIKGRGGDWDWQGRDLGWDQVTDYGALDAYGDQKIFSFEIGRDLVNDDAQRLSVLLGLVQQDTNNELRNIVYYRFNGIDIEPQSQADIGSTLDGRFRGIRLGVEQEQKWSKWTLIGMVGVSVLETKAYGHWANHNPAWDWVDSGYTLGLNGNLALQYTITSNVLAELGYYSSYAKNYFDLDACDESITGEGLPETGALLIDEVILRYKQQGFRLGLKVRF